MKILLTGVAGFIGSHLAQMYLKQGHSVIGIDNLSTGKKVNIPSGVQFIYEDISDLQSLFTVFQTEKPDCVNHQAAITETDSEKNEQDYFITNLIGSSNIFQLAVMFQVPKIIFASSAAVYGNTKTIPSTEDLPCNPINLYGKSKLFAEQLLQKYVLSKSTNFIVLRYANVYGKNNQKGVIHRFMQELVKKNMITIKEDGTQTRDFVNIDDVVSANCLALNINQNITLNISTQTETSINQLANEITTLTNTYPSIKHSPSKIKEIYHSCLSNTLAYNRYHWKPKIELRSGLKQLLSSYDN